MVRRSLELLDTAARLFSSCLEDPLQPRCCSRALCGCLHLLDGSDKDDICSLLQPYFKVKDQEDTYKYVRKKYPGYLNASVAFISMYHSDKDKEDLRAGLEPGRCPGCFSLVLQEPSSVFCKPARAGHWRQCLRNPGEKNLPNTSMHDSLSSPCPADVAFSSRQIQSNTHPLVLKKGP